MKQQRVTNHPEKPRDGYFSDGAGGVPSIQAGIWKHYKGGYYQVLGVGAHSETDELFVIYVSLNGIDRSGPRIRLRPLSMWFDTITIMPVQAGGPQGSVRRFVYVGIELPLKAEEKRQP